MRRRSSNRQPVPFRRLGSGVWGREYTMPDLPLVKAFAFIREAQGERFDVVGVIQKTANPDGSRRFMRTFDTRASAERGLEELTGVIIKAMQHTAAVFGIPAATVVVSEGVCYEVGDADAFDA